MHNSNLYVMWEMFKDENKILFYSYYFIWCKLLEVQSLRIILKTYIPGVKSAQKRFDELTLIMKGG